MVKKRIGGLITLSHYKKVISGLSFSKSFHNKHILGEIVKKYEWNKSLCKGYAEMSEINLELAQMSVSVDNECIRQYEEKLTECE